MSAFSTRRRDAIEVFLHAANFHEICIAVITSNYAVSHRAMNPKVIREKGEVGQLT